MTHIKEFYTCPNCGRPILPEKEKYFVCPNCGRALCKAEDLKDFSDKFCGNCGCDLSSAKEFEKQERTLKQTEKKFINSDDYIDYQISVHHQESAEKIKSLFTSFTEELFKILENDRITAETKKSCGQSIINK